MAGKHKPLAGSLGKSRRARAQPSPHSFDRLNRQLSLVGQVEQALRQAIGDGRFPSGKLPTALDLAEQLGVSRETVRLACEPLQREGLLVKIRHRGTFTQPPRLAGQIKVVENKLLGYLQTDFLVVGNPSAIGSGNGREEVANRSISGLMLQGALAEAGNAGFSLIVERTPHTRWREAVQQFVENTRLGGIILASYGEEKLLRRLAARGLATVLVDEDTNVSRIHSVRDDCFEGARLAVQHLARLGHRRIAYAHWNRDESNRWRPHGYRQGLRDAGLTPRRHWEIPTELTEAGARGLCDRLLALRPRPTALYCFNNTLAAFAIMELERRGVRVPRDLSVMGAGGEEIAGLTCHQIDWYQMGRTAVEVLLRALAHTERVKAEHHLSPHTLRPGQTTAPLTAP